MDPRQPVTLVSPEGEERTLEPWQAAEYRQAGWAPADMPKLDDRGLLRTAMDTWMAQQLGVARGVTLGLSDTALRTAGVPADFILRHKEDHPVASGAGRTAGWLGAAVLAGLSGGKSAVAKSGLASAAKFTPAGAVAVVSNAVKGGVAAKTGSGVLGKMISGAAGSAVTGAALGAANVIESAAIINNATEMSATEELLQIGTSALFGAALGAALPAIPGITKGIVRKIAKDPLVMRQALQDVAKGKSIANIAKDRGIKDTDLIRLAKQKVVGFEEKAQLVRAGREELQQRYSQVYSEMGAMDRLAKKLATSDAHYEKLMMPRPALPSSLENLQEVSSFRDVLWTAVSRIKSLKKLATGEELKLVINAEQSVSSMYEGVNNLARGIGMTLSYRGIPGLSEKAAFVLSTGKMPVTKQEQAVALKDLHSFFRSKSSELVRAEREIKLTAKKVWDALPKEDKARLAPDYNPTGINFERALSNFLKAPTASRATRLVEHYDRLLAFSSKDWIEKVADSKVVDSVLTHRDNLIKMKNAFISEDIQRGAGAEITRALREEIATVGNMVTPGESVVGAAKAAGAAAFGGMGASALGLPRQVGALVGAAGLKGFVSGPGVMDALKLVSGSARLAKGAVTGWAYGHGPVAGAVETSLQKMPLQTIMWLEKLNKNKLLSPLGVERILFEAKKMSLDTGDHRVVASNIASGIVTETFPGLEGYAKHTVVRTVSKALEDMAKDLKKQSLMSKIAEGLKTYSTDAAQESVRAMQVAFQKEMQAMTADPIVERLLKTAKEGVPGAPEAVQPIAQEAAQHLLDTRPHDRWGSGLDWRNWALRWQTILDPYSVITAVEFDTLSPLQIQTLGLILPDFKAELQRQMMEKYLPELDNIPYSKRRALSILFEQPVDHAHLPNALMQLQQRYLKESPGVGAQVPQPISFQRTPRTHRDSLTQTQRLLGRPGN